MRNCEKCRAGARCPCHRGRSPDLMLRAYVAYHRKKGRTLAWIARSLDRALSGIGRIVNDLELKGELPW